MGFKERFYKFKKKLLQGCENNTYFNMFPQDVQSKKHFFGFCFDHFWFLSLLKDTFMHKKYNIKHVLYKNYLQHCLKVHYVTF